jgi:hypothetical protein
MLLKKVFINNIANDTSTENSTSIIQQIASSNATNPITQITNAINNSGNINLIVIIIVCVVILCCLSCIAYTCYRCIQKNPSPYPGVVLPIQIPNNECIRDNPIDKSNSVIRKLSYITPVKENKYIDHDRAYHEPHRYHTMTYLDDDFYPRRHYIERNFTDIPSRRIKYIDY